MTLQPCPGTYALATVPPSQVWNRGLIYCPRTTVCTSPASSCFIDWPVADKKGKLCSLCYTVSLLHSSTGIHAPYYPPPYETWNLPSRSVRDTCFLVSFRGKRMTWLEWACVMFLAMYTHLAGKNTAASWEIKDTLGICSFQGIYWSCHSPLHSRGAVFFGSFHTVCYSLC